MSINPATGQPFNSSPFAITPPANVNQVAATPTGATATTQDKTNINPATGKAFTPPNTAISDYLQQHLFNHNQWMEGIKGGTGYSSLQDLLNPSTWKNIDVNKGAKIAGDVGTLGLLGASSIANPLNIITNGAIGVALKATGISDTLNKLSSMVDDAGGKLASIMPTKIQIGKQTIPLDNQYIQTITRAPFTALATGIDVLPMILGKLAIKGDANPAVTKTDIENLITKSGGENAMKASPQTLAENIIDSIKNTQNEAGKVVGKQDFRGHLMASDQNFKERFPDVELKIPTSAEVQSPIDIEKNPISGTEGTIYYQLGDLYEDVLNDGHLKVSPETLDLIKQYQNMAVKNPTTGKPEQNNLETINYIKKSLGNEPNMPWKSTNGLTRNIDELTYNKMYKILSDIQDKYTPNALQPQFSEAKKAYSDLTGMLDRATTYKSGDVNSGLIKNIMMQPTETNLFTKYSAPTVKTAALRYLYDQSLDNMGNVNNIKLGKAIKQMGYDTINVNGQKNPLGSKLFGDDWYRLKTEANMYPNGIQRLGNVVSTLFSSLPGGKEWHNAAEGIQEAGNRNTSNQEYKVNPNLNIPISAQSEQNQTTQKRSNIITKRNNNNKFEAGEQ